MAGDAHHESVCDAIQSTLHFRHEKYLREAIPFYLTLMGHG